MYSSLSSETKFYIMSVCPVFISNKCCIQGPTSQIGKVMFERGHSRSKGVNQGQITRQCCMDIGWCSRHWMLKLFAVNSKYVTNLLYKYRAGREGRGKKVLTH